MAGHSARYSDRSKQCAIAETTYPLPYQSLHRNRVVIDYPHVFRTATVSDVSLFDVQIERIVNLSELKKHIAELHPLVTASIVENRCKER